MNKVANFVAAALALTVVAGVQSASAFEVKGNVEITTEQKYSPAVAIGKGANAQVGTFQACGTNFGGNVRFTAKQKYSPAVAIGKGANAQVGTVMFGDNSCFKK